MTSPLNNGNLVKQKRLYSTVKVAVVFLKRNSCPVTVTNGGGGVMGILLVLRPKIDPQGRKYPKQRLAAPPYTQLGQWNGAWELHSGFWAAQFSELRRVSDSGPRIDKSR